MERYRVILPQNETVVDEGPHSLRETLGFTVIWRGDETPNDNILDSLCDNLPPRMDRVETTGFKRRFGFIEDIIVERAETMKIQKRRLAFLGWKTIETIDELKYANIV